MRKHVSVHLHPYYNPSTPHTPTYHIPTPTHTLTHIHTDLIDTSMRRAISKKPEKKRYATVDLSEHKATGVLDELIEDNKRKKEAEKKVCGV